MRNVVVKFYGSELLDGSTEFKMNDVAAEAVIFQILAEHSLAAGLIGVFDDGRIEQYVAGRNLTVDDFSDFSIVSEIARKLAKFHSLSMPVSREVNFLEKMRKTFENVCEKDAIEDVEECEIGNIKALFNFPLFEEIDYFIKIAPSLNSPIVFSHNDFLYDNLLLKSNCGSSNDRILFMDFELSSYNYRGYDIGYFLMMTQFRSDHESVAFKYAPTDNFDAMKRYFVSEYLRETRRMSRNLDERVDNVDHLLLESDILGLHLLIYHFGFWRASIYQFIDHYFEVKQQVLEKYDDKVN
ncbi:choline/ethanolamine kinase-like protein [Leptotrombidium deliense]|uniref:Choline/ethanolamine kinase-like protein n=1 Tax=Leptotrombidium deliense TaxID=299467 RepID=A0A443S6X4_9ACAR|nr:choline/ethanolamine kinase-like protein [Leptotrombidium deliense]